ncbi:hypothetical protein FE394_16600 [Xenorhabdus sp. Reich]|uniref:Uncharacterized protein n=1 Tax=Xenorhabdus littoralis TaxID=2582835 RepID=A0ABU4SQ49_9GAMM|nr:hypothetical protein [Xenorhabdus sp. Reich]MDX8000763.1 hypothetical protein [Xenorhabdus sp. Reich]
MSNTSLPKPTLPQAKQGIINKAEIGDTVKIYVPKYYGIADKDEIKLTFGSISIPIFSVKNPDGLSDPFLIAEVGKSDIPDGIYGLYYTVQHFTNFTSNQSEVAIITFVDKGTVTPPTSNDKSFILMGARSTLYTSANALYGPQRITAWDKKTMEPVEVTWKYEGNPKVNMSWQSFTGSSFLDNAPDLPLTATLGQHSITLNPINIFSNGGTSDSDYTLTPVPGQPDGTPARFRSSFAALANNGDLYAWGGIFPAGGGRLLGSNVKKVAAGAYGYIALKNDGSLSAWKIPNDIDFEIAPESSEYVDVAAGGTNFIALQSDGTVNIWGFGIPPIRTNLGPADKTILVGNDDAVFGFNTQTTTSCWIRNSGAYMGGGWINYTYGIDYQYPRAIVPTRLGFIFLHENGNGELLLPEISTDPNNRSYIPHSVYPGDFVQVVCPVDWDGFNPVTGTGIVFLDKSGVVTVYSHHSSNQLPYPGSPIVDIASNKNTYVMIDGTGVSAGGRDPYPSSLSNIVQVTSSAAAYASLGKDGSVTTWGDDMYGGWGSNPRDVQKAIYATGKAFVGLTDDDRLILWGDASGGGVDPFITSALDGKISYYRK